MKLKLLLFSLLIISPAVSYGQLSKYQALYLYNFTRYVEWPTEYQTGDFIIGVVGSGEDITPELKDIASKRKVGSQSIVIQEFRKASDLSKCHILFIPKSKMSDYANYIDKAKSLNTLIVTESSSFPDGAAINLVFDGTKLKYDLNIPNAKSHDLKVSEKLVAVSK